MPDDRFFTTKSPLSPRELCDFVGGVLIREAQQDIHAVASPNGEQIEQTVVYCADKKSVSALVGKPFAAVLTTEALAGEFAQAGSVIAVKNPRHAFALVAERLHGSIEEDGRDHDAADPAIDASVEVHATATLAKGVVIGKNVRIGAHCHIGCGVVIGAGSNLGTHVSITHAVLGQRVRVLPGARIGQAGFGFVPVEGGLVRMPQLGRVLIEDEVEIGANATVDRGALDDTVIGAGTKIDNLVQIAHNVKLGRSCVIAAQTGISGSCTIGDGVFMGGQVGLADHLTIGDGAQLAAQAGLMRDVPPGEKVGGSPARSVKDWLRESAALAKLAKNNRQKS